MNRNKEIYQDCVRNMWKAYLILSFSEIVTIGANVWIANSVGNFTNYLLMNDIEKIMENILWILASICLGTLILPLITLCGNTVLFYCSLEHDRLIFKKYLELPLARQKEITAGEAQYRLENDPNEFRWAILEIVRFGLSIPFSIIIVLCVIPKSMRVLICLFAGVKFIINDYLGKIYADNCKIMRDTNTELRGYEIDLCDNLMIYLSMGFGKKVQHFLRDFFKDQYDEKLRKAVTVNGAAEAYTVWMDKFSQIILLLMGCVGISMKFMTISEVIEIMVIFPTLEVIIKQMETCIKNRHNLKELLERMKFFYCREGQELHDVPEGEIEVEDLVFGYQEELVLRNVNFTLSKNKNVIYGKNGSGKSTLLKLLCGFLTNYQGKIKIGSMDLRGNEESWFQKYAYVSQNTMIFEGTLEENIAMSEKFDDVRMKKIIRETDLNHLLGRIVKKEDVSGGERQRISIARALYSEREWLLLDEPDKHLDSDTLQWLENFIKETDRKLVYVTHSDELKEYADKCIAL